MVIACQQPIVAGGWGSDDGVFYGDAWGIAHRLRCENRARFLTGVLAASLVPNLPTYAERKAAGRFTADLVAATCGTCLRGLFGAYFVKDPERVETILRAVKRTGGWENGVLFIYELAGEKEADDE